ncbi:hypothetical protein P2G88_06430 [Aliiglaciecola sp. CAU 1673]|uniref:hypothetical protein n=1 Tax=Aliiglaciecola sp. CAU 1673 TaxID=3032595 RepID=UPI0023DB1D07|nr:hypothetical protein [Aliiglaciecola sp. CAU 1673]MDF2177883.1 hypothetical protein [Aliiglaciecola sp. CAU 1673]
MLPPSMRLAIKSTLATTLCLCVSMAWAGNTGGVFGPVIDPQDRSLQYRYANAFGENGRDDNFAHRLHYQQAINADYHWRVALQYRDNQADLEFDQARAELLWQFQHSTQDNSDWDSAIRFDLIVREDDKPKDFGVNWTNQWRLSADWSARAILMSAVQFGENPGSGVQIRSRYSLTYKLPNKHSLALEGFFDHGNTSDFGQFHRKTQQIGPALNGKFAPFSYKLSYLRGISDASPDNSVIMWLNYDL